VSWELGCANEAFWVEGSWQYQCHNMRNYEFLYCTCVYMPGYGWMFDSCLCHIIYTPCVVLFLCYAMHRCKNCLFDYINRNKQWNKWSSQVRVAKYPLTKILFSYLISASGVKHRWLYPLASRSLWLWVHSTVSFLQTLVVSMSIICRQLSVCQ